MTKKFKKKPTSNYHVAKKSYIHSSSGNDGNRTDLSTVFNDQDNFLITRNDQSEIVLLLIEIQLQTIKYHMKKIKLRN